MTAPDPSVDETIDSVRAAVDDLHGMCSPDGARDAYRDLVRGAQVLIAELSRLRTDDVASRLATAAAAISRTVTQSYPRSMDPELVMRRRLGKVNVEAGELWDAVEGWTGENPRKGVYATEDDVVKELIDCASASLCALEYMTGDRGDSVRMVAEQVAGNWTRLQAAMVGGGRG